MSRDITISEGNVSRGFGGTRKLKTALQGEGADSCYWVPEIETRVNPVFIAENGIHEAAEAGEYGYSVAHVNIPEKHIDLEGNEWDITIDEDGIPHIEIEDIEVGEIEITIDDETGEIEINIDDQEIEIDPEKLELDPDEDIDVSIDVDDLEVDIVGTDLDGEDVLVDLDLETLDFDTLNCPAEIIIIHNPNKTRYKEGEATDLDGLVVQAFDKDGNVWTSPQYPDGYIPTDKITTSQTSPEDYLIPEYDSSVTDITSNGSIAYALNKLGDKNTEAMAETDASYKEEGRDVNFSQAYEEALRKVSSDVASYENSVGEFYLADIGPFGYSSGFLIDGALVLWVFDELPQVLEKDVAYPCTRLSYGYYFTYRGEFGFVGPNTRRETKVVSQGETSDTISTANMVKDEGAASVTISWETPCLETLNTSFTVHIDTSGSHHSGKF